METGNLRNLQRRWDHFAILSLSTRAGWLTDEGALTPSARRWANGRLHIVHTQGNQGKLGHSIRGERGLNVGVQARLSVGGHRSLVGQLDGRIRRWSAGEDARVRSGSSSNGTRDGVGSWRPDDREVPSTTTILVNDDGGSVSRRRESGHVGFADPIGKGSGIAFRCEV